MPDHQEPINEERDPEIAPKNEVRQSWDPDLDLAPLGDIVLKLFKGIYGYAYALADNEMSQMIADGIVDRPLPTETEIDLVKARADFAAKMLKWRLENMPEEIRKDIDLGLILKHIISGLSQVHGVMENECW